MNTTGDTTSVLIAIAHELRKIRNILHRAYPDPKDEPTAALIDAALGVSEALESVREANATGELHEATRAMRKLADAHTVLLCAANAYREA